MSKQPPIHPTITSSIYHLTYLVIHPYAHVSTQLSICYPQHPFICLFISLPAPHLYSCPRLCHLLYVACVIVSLSNFLFVTHHLLIAKVTDRANLAIAPGTTDHWDLELGSPEGQAPDGQKGMYQTHLIQSTYKSHMSSLFKKILIVKVIL